MNSFRNRGIFYEHVTNQILDDLVVALLQPRRMTVVGDFSVRGGMTTAVTATLTSEPLHEPAEPRERATPPHVSRASCEFRVILSGGLPLAMPSWIPCTFPSRVNWISTALRQARSDRLSRITRTRP